MKFRSVMRLWIIWLMLLASAFVYAADEEDILSISPTGDTGPGKYEITISGTRNWDTAIVQEYTTEVRTQDCEYLKGTYGCGASVTVKAYISPGKNPALGSTTYQKKFDIFLDARIYSFSYLIIVGGDPYYKSGKVIMPSNIYGYDNMLFVESRRPPVNISLLNATAEITGTDSFTLRNLAGETTDSQGVSQKFNAWGIFRWNPDTLSFELKDAGLQ